MMEHGNIFRITTIVAGVHTKSKLASASTNESNGFVITDQI